MTHHNSRGNKLLEAFLAARCLDAQQSCLGQPFSQQVQAQPARGVTCPLRLFTANSRKSGLLHHTVGLYSENATMQCNQHTGSLHAAPASTGHVSMQTQHRHSQHWEALQSGAAFLTASLLHTSPVDTHAVNTVQCRCGHCKALAPHYVKVAANLKGIATVAAVDCDDAGNRQLCGRFGVQASSKCTIPATGCQMHELYRRLLPMRKRVQLSARNAVHCTPSTWPY